MSLHSRTRSKRLGLCTVYLDYMNSREIPKKKLVCETTWSLTNIRCVLERYSTRARHAHDELTIRAHKQDFYAPCSCLSALISPNRRLISFSVRVGGTMRQSSAPNYPCNVTTHTHKNETQMMHVPERKVRQSEEPKLRRSYRNTCQCWSDQCEL
jgi:hypothetical protein